MYDLSIIIVSYNTKKITEDCLDSIFKSLELSPSLTVEAIIIDNNSTDGSPEMLERYLEKVPSKHSMQIILEKTNLGFGKANNKGVKRARSKYVLLLNSDIVVLDNAVEELYSQFKTSSYNFAGGKLLNMDLSDQNSCGRFPTILNAFMSLFLQGDALKITRYSPNTQQKVDWLSGACIICKKSDYEKINGFDESIFMYWEEVDLLYRANRNNMTTGFLPSARFIHLEGASSDKSFPIRGVYIGYILFCRKHKNQFNLYLIKTMLKFKSLTVVIIGTILNNRSLVNTYKNAYEAIKKI